MNTVTVLAPAKITLSLRLTGVRDDGYHLIDAEMVSVAWADALTITPGGSGLTAEGPFASGMPLDHTNPEKNFSAALRLLVEQGLLKKGDTTVIAGAVLSGTQRVDAVQMRVVD